MKKIIILLLNLASTISIAHPMKETKVSFSQLEEPQETFLISNQCPFSMIISWSKNKWDEIQPYTCTNYKKSLLIESKKIGIRVNDSEIFIPKKSLKNAQDTNWTFTPFFTHDFHNLEALHLILSNGKPSIVLSDKKYSNNSLIRNLKSPITSVKFHQKESNSIGFNTTPLNLKETIKNLNFKNNCLNERQTSKEENITVLNQIPVAMKLCYKTHNKESFAIESDIHPFKKNNVISSPLNNYNIKHLGLMINNIPFISRSQDLMKALRTSHILVPIFDIKIHYLVGIIILPYHDNTPGVFFSIHSEETEFIIKSISQESKSINFKDSPFFSKENTHNYAVDLLDFAYND